MDKIKRRKYSRRTMHPFLKSLIITLMCFVMIVAGYFAASLGHTVLNGIGLI